MALLDGHRSIFSFAPILSLASLRIALGDIDGAQAVYDRVTADPHHDLRVGMVAFPAVRCELLAARGEHAQAAAVLRSIETIRDQRLAAYPAADHLWLEAAAYLASRADRLGDASTLSWAANQTAGPGPFITWSLEEQFANNDAWLAARATPPTIERARQTARLIARHL